MRKVQLCSDIDPFDLASDEVQQDINLLTRVDIADSGDYLVYATNFVAKERRKAKKGLEAHHYVTSEWVQQPFTRAFADGRVIVIGKASTI